MILTLQLAACTASLSSVPSSPDGASSDGSSQGPIWQSAEHFTQQCDAALTHAEALREALTRAEAPAPGATLKELNQIFLALDEVGGWSALLFNAHPEPPLRDAARACQERVTQLRTALSLDRAVYEAVVQDDDPSFDAFTARFRSHNLRNFRRAGVDKPPAVRERIAAIQQELTRLSQEYMKNVRENVRTIELTSVEQLAGLPEDYIAAHPPDADGKIHISTDYPDFYPFQKYADDGALREKLYAEYLSRGYPANEELLVQVLGLRQEYATLLGHARWTDYYAEDKMASSSEVVRDFIAKLVDIVRPRAEQELKALLKTKQADGPDAEKIEVWDRFYYVGKLQQQEAGFDPQSVRAYFPYSRVTDGILDLYGELFQLEFIRLHDEPVWHPSVAAYSMRSAGEELGRFYLDMHPRDGKYKHAASFDIRTGIANERMPIGSLLCNFPEPSGEDQALMDHSDVITYFHEFGHLIHQLLARRSQWVSLNGFNVEWDFVEAPSQLLEEWAWDADVLARFAKHVDTHEPIPADLVAKMRAADEFGKGVHVLRQLFLTAFSFFLHDRDPSQIQIDQFADEMYQLYSPYPRMQGDHLYANFGHLMGYTSAYYTYQWSLVIAKDLFTRFSEAGLLDKEAALSYRREVLEPGGTLDAKDLVKGFLGREYNFDAYREWIEAE